MRLPDPVNSRALLLGTSSYDSEDLVDLPSVAGNVEDLAGFITNANGTGLSREHCASIVNEREPAAIGQRLRAAANEASDMLLVYYAGHGLIGQDGSLYLSLPGTHADLIEWSALQFEHLRRLMASARAVNKVLILDCCFSGLAVEAMSDIASMVAGTIEVSGTCTLTSSPANRPSSAPEGARNTAFTGELLTLLHDGVPGDAEFLTLSVIYQHLLQATQRRGLPRPEARHTRTVSNLALARNRGRPTSGVQRARNRESGGFGENAKAGPRSANGGLRLAHTAERNRDLDRGDLLFYRIRVSLVGGPEDLNRVQKVVYHLHETFPEPDRTVSNRATRFELDTAAWGQFDLTADVYLKDRVTPLRLQRFISL